MIFRILAIICTMLFAVAGTPGDGNAEVIQEGPKTCQGMALTFDLCPVREGSGYDQPLIEFLKDAHIPATFFMSGRWMAKHEAEVRGLLAVPFFEVGTHGHAHAHLPLLDEDAQRREIQGAVTWLQTRYGHQAPLFRPPYGEYNEATVKIVQALGLRFILWNIASGDPDPHLSRDRIVQTVKTGTRNGSIILFHANGKGKRTREVVEALYQDLIRPRGLQPMTVTELLTCRQQAKP
jgi:peptidoglycan/xylan/chitin deacetylase (PgdA/CDA1 family)